MASEILAAAFVTEGKYATAFPSFGVERRGAPVSAFIRLDETDIRERTQVYFPDCLIFTDPFFKDVSQVYAGLKANGILILNSREALTNTPNENVKTAGTINATGIALEEIKRPSTNTCLVGAFAATTGWVSLDSRFDGLERILERKGPGGQ